MYFRSIIFILIFIMACSDNNKAVSNSDTKSSTEVPLRSEIDAKYKWDMTAVYPTEEAWEEDLNFVKELYPGILEFKGKLVSSPDVLLEALELDNKINQTLWKLYHYASNSSNADVRNEKYQEMVQRVINTYVKIGEVSAFFTPEILENDYSVIENLMEKNDKLKIYEKQFKDCLLYTSPSPRD